MSSFILLREEENQFMKQANLNMLKIQENINSKQRAIINFEEKVKNEILQKQNSKHQNDKKAWGLPSYQKKIRNQLEISNKYSLKKDQQTVKQEQFFTTLNKNTWDYNKIKDQMKVNISDSEKYYPPSCSGYDIAYCKAQNAIFIYGGISCETVLEEGIKTFFYKYHKEKWTEVKPESIYCPMPRYAHTLSCFQKQLILFGGVSEYKQKLKDRCFYSDISVYNIQKNQWRIMQTGGNFAKTRKSHAVCTFGKYFFICGGINENDEVINDISWISLEQKKPRWKNINCAGRFNHKIIAVQTKSKQFLVIFGGRNQQSQIISTLSIILTTQTDGQINLKEPITINHQISARELPLMQRFSQGFIILGGVNEDNEVVTDTWYYQAEKQCFQKLELELDYNELRGCQGVSTTQERLYVLGRNSKKYKALEIEHESRNT